MSELNWFLNSEFWKVGTSKDDFITGLEALHSPPTGGAVERDRLKYYLERAAQTKGKFKFDSEQAREDFWKSFRNCLSGLMLERPPPTVFRRENLLEKRDGVECLRYDVFLDAYYQLSPQSNPGFPLNYHFSSNADLDLSILYKSVNDLFMKMVGFDTKEKQDQLRAATAMQCFTSGLLDPAMIFVKNEPTKKSKIARLIYGMSVRFNIVSRILFGSYLQRLPESWHVASHKVGMDFNTDEGLAKLKTFHQKMCATAERLGGTVESSDVSGWEYIYSERMEFEWHLAYIRVAMAYYHAAHPSTSSVQVPENARFFVNIHAVFSILSRKILVASSDGYLMEPRSFFMLSGKLLTHLANSDCRGAVAKMAGFEQYSTYNEALRDSSIPAARLPIPDGVVCSDNGDDNVSIVVHQKNSERVYHMLGMVVTDRQVQTPGRLDFCSQTFLFERDATYRIPTSLPKIIYNLCSRLNEQEAVNGILQNFTHHPGKQHFVRFALNLQSAVANSKGLVRVKSVQPSEKKLRNDEDEEPENEKADGRC